MSIDQDLVIPDEENCGPMPSRVDIYAERLILAEEIKKAKQKHLEELIEQGERRKARFRLLVYLMLGLGVYYLHTINAWKYIQEFFVRMSQ